MTATAITGLIEPLPWQDEAWQDIQTRLKRDALPHALLLSGAEGVGKAHFAHYLALALLCREPSPSGAPCGLCRGCQLNQAGNHPDLVYISVLPDKKEIGINQIRDLITLLTLKPQYGGYKVIIIHPADAMKHHAANSLLKTLEEPPPGNLLLLCSSRPTSLPATIRSRCQSVIMPRPGPAIAQDWLKGQLAGDAEALAQLDSLLSMAEGGPLKAMEIARAGRRDERKTFLLGLEQLVAGRLNATKVAEEWLKLGAKESLYWLHSGIIDMIRLAMSVEPVFLNNPDLRQPLQALAQHMDKRRLFFHLDKTAQAMNLLDQPLNQQLMIEDLLIAWCKKR